MTQLRKTVIRVHLGRAGHFINEDGYRLLEVASIGLYARIWYLYMSKSDNFWTYAIRHTCEARRRKYCEEYKVNFGTSTNFHVRLTRLNMIEQKRRN